MIVGGGAGGIMAAGLYKESDIQHDNANFIPDGVNWVKDEVTVFDPDNNKVTTAKNGDVSYDYLVVATGIAYDYEGIEGMSTDLVGKNGISSVYLNDPVAGTARGGVATAQWFKEMRAAAEAASPENPIKVICTT